MHVLTEGPQVADLLDLYRVARPEPWVLANMVAGLDGCAAVEGRVGALSSGPDAILFRRLRSVADAVLVGAETVRSERYGPVRLDEDLLADRRNAGRLPTPFVAVVSRSLRLEWDSPLFTDADASAPTLVLTCDAADRDALREARRHARVHVCPGERVDPADALVALREIGARTVLCEGGPTLLGELAAADLLDELCLTVEPLMGADPLPVAVRPAGHSDLARFELRHAALDANTLFLRYTREASGHG